MGIYIDIKKMPTKDERKVLFPRQPPEGKVNPGLRCGELERDANSMKKIEKLNRKDLH